MNFFTVFLSGASHLIKAADGSVVVQGALNGALAQGIGCFSQLFQVVAQLTVVAASGLPVPPVTAAREGHHSNAQPQEQVRGDLHRHTAVPGQPAAI
ncbi:MAG: hypothetical protein ACRER3_04250 [Pseudomonas fluorescens]